MVGKEDAKDSQIRFVNKEKAAGVRIATIKETAVNRACSVIMITNYVKKREAAPSMRVALIWIMMDITNMILVVQGAMIAMI
jgi:hypothetical protein